jgi:hypothetical protein
MQGSTLFWLLALGATAAFLMVRAHNQVRRIAQPGVNPARARHRAPQNSVQPPDKPLAAQRWEVEMHETVRAWSAQLDSKLSALQHFIRLAEQASIRLEGAIAEARYLGGASPQTAAQPAASIERAASQADALRASLRRATAAAAEIPRAAETMSGERPISRIHALADAGYDSAAIAEHVASPIGEVELILSLRRQAAG